MTSSFSRIVCVVIAVCCTALPARAQNRPDRPYRGLFGGNGGSSEWGESLTANGSVGVGVDNNLLAVTGIAGDNQDLIENRPQLQEYRYLTAGLSYSVRKSRVGFGASVATSGQYVPNLTSPYVQSHSGAVGISLQVSRRSQLSASHSIYLQPYNILVLGLPMGDPLLGQAVPIDSAFGIRREDHVSQSSDVGFTRQLGRRGSLAFGYGHMRSGASDSSGGELTSQTGSGRYSTALTRGLGVHAGYTYTEARFGNEPAFATGHNLDAGLDFSRTLSVSRRTTLSFNTGSSYLKDYQRSYFRLTGGAALTREIGRTWAATAAYNRGMGFIERFQQPFFNDSLTLGLGGLFSRRLSFQSSAGAVKGDLGLGTNGNAFRSYYGTAGLTLGITRMLALGTDYTYYRYGFAHAEGLPTGIARQLGRHSARVYLSVWVPILQRGRRTNASR